MNQLSLLTVIISFLVCTNCWSQKTDFELVKKGVDHIYNFDFKRSDAIIARLESINSKSPTPDLMKALQIYWKYYPVQNHEDQLEAYHDYLERSYLKSIEIMERQQNNWEALFLAMASQGLLAESYSESGRSFKAVGAAKKAYRFVKQGIEKLNQFDEFYVSTGLYNYYREYYPDAYPIYKPFMSFFMKGDRKLGIRQLEIAEKKASIAHVIARYYLSYIYLRYEYIPVKALEQGKALHYEYPGNHLFTAIYCESLIINQKYKQATHLSRKLQKNPNPFYKVYGELFMGIIQENEHQDYKNAERLYRSTLDFVDTYDMNQPHLEALAYLGLGRIYQHKNDPKARGFFRESLDKAYTKSLKSEAKRYLN